MNNFKVVFADRRSGEQLVLPPVRLGVVRYSKAAVGGCKQAELRAEGTVNDLMQFVAWLGHRVTIIGTQGRHVWWGKIAKVIIPVGALQVVVDIETMASRVAVAYTQTTGGQASSGARATTDWEEDDEVVAELGRREVMLTLGGVSSDIAEAYRDRALEAAAHPAVALEMAEDESAVGTATIICIGRWQTLDWRYASVPVRLSLMYDVIGTGGFSLTALGYRLGQAFLTGASAINVAYMDVVIKKVGSPTDNLRVSLCAYVSDTEIGSELAYVDIVGSALSTSFATVRVTLASPYLLAANSRYYLTFGRTGATSSPNSYQVNLDMTMGFGNGVLIRGDYPAGPFTAYNADVPFWLYENSLIETTQQIQSLLTSFGQFLGQVRMEIASGITSESYQDGDTDAQTVVEELMMAGTTNGLRVLAEVLEDDSVRVFEQASTSTYSVVDRNGVFFDTFGQPAEKSSCPVGMWVLPKDIMRYVATGIVSGFRPSFIEEMEYDAEADMLYWQTADANNPFDLGVQDG